MIPILAKATDHSPRPAPYRLEADRQLATLLEQIAEGDQPALARLYDLTHRLLFGLALRILGDRSVAEEALLDTFMQVWRQAGRYDEQRGAPMAWLLTIMRSRSLDYLRANKPHRERIEIGVVNESRLPSPENPETLSALAERQSLVRTALNRLPADQQQAIELVYFGGLSHSEVAARLALPLGTVKTRIRLAMNKLRQELLPVAAEWL